MVCRNSFTDKIKEYVYLKYEGKCADCKKLLRGYWFRSKCIYNPKMCFAIQGAHIHHIIFIKDGGRHCKNNFVLLCISCHLKRHGKLLKEERRGNI